MCERGFTGKKTECCCLCEQHIFVFTSKVTAVILWQFTGLCVRVANDIWFQFILHKFILYTTIFAIPYSKEVTSQRVCDFGLSQMGNTYKLMKPHMVFHTLIKHLNENMWWIMNINMCSGRGSIMPSLMEHCFSPHFITIRLPSSLCSLCTGQHRCPWVPVSCRVWDTAPQWQC